MEQDIPKCMACIFTVCIHVLANYATESVILNSLFRDLFYECGIPLENAHSFFKVELFLQKRSDPSKNRKRLHFFQKDHPLDGRFILCKNIDHIAP